MGKRVARPGQNSDDRLKELEMSLIDKELKRVSGRGLRSLIRKCGMVGFGKMSNRGNWIALRTELSPIFTRGSARNYETLCTLF